MSDLRLEPLAPSRLRQSAALALLTVGLGLTAGLLTLPSLPAAAAAVALLLYAGVALAILGGIGEHRPSARFGLANWITLARAAGAAALAGALVAPEMLARPEGAWAATALAAVLLALDGLDGWAARRQRLCSRFGARFDIEVDTLLILVLSGLGLALGKAGAWVLALGLMRYGFVAAGLLVPRLRAELFPSMRRKAVCVLQIGVLIALLAPPVVPPLSAALAAAALAALAASFAVDVRWLLRRGR